MSISDQIKSSLSVLIDVQADYNYNKDRLDFRKHPHLDTWLERIMTSAVPDKLCHLYFTLGFKNFSDFDAFKIQNAHLMFQSKVNCTLIDQLYKNVSNKAVIDQVCEDIAFLSNDAKQTLDVLLKRKRFIQ